ncbi:MAG: hypothetical protein WC655_07685 [Candidatus Hydrogenedentales bacterium]
MEIDGALWDPARVAQEITEGAIFRVLGEEARAALLALDVIPARVITALTDPKPLDITMPVLDAVLAAQYFEVIEALQPPRTMTVFEPCVGASCPVILATEAYGGGQANYTTINLNRKLREQLHRKIAHLKSDIRVIEDNAQNVSEYLAPGSVDIACFHHAVNDILQTAVSEPRGMNTTDIDWFPNERQMIEWLAEDARAGRLEQRGKPELMQIVGDVVKLVRPGGYLLFDHFNWCRFIGVDWFPWDLFYNLIPMTRQWIAESGLPVSEVRLRASIRSGG